MSRLKGPKGNLSIVLSVTFLIPSENEFGNESKLIKLITRNVIAIRP